MGVVLDTSILIAAEREKFDLEALFLSLKNETVFVSAITLSELWHGCHRGKGPMLPERFKHVNYLEAKVPVLGFGTEEALVHAKLWAALEKIGQGIGLHDLIIAATAVAHGHTIATLNELEFKRVPGLRMVAVKRFILK
jgi:tRNA(fMet)-specific endonuclease VapC